MFLSAGLQKQLPLDYQLTLLKKTRNYTLWLGFNQHNLIDAFWEKSDIGNRTSDDA